MKSTRRGEEGRQRRLSLRRLVDLKIRRGIQEERRQGKWLLGAIAALLLKAELNSKNERL